MTGDTESTAPDEPPDPDLAKPRLTAVLGLLALTSLTFSYLGAYAVSAALVNAEVLRRWHPDADPRPRWLATGFGVLLATFVLVAGVVRHLSNRQLKRIDEMADDAPDDAWDEASGTQ